MILRFLYEYIKWNLRGRPIRTVAQTSMIFTTKCEPCDEFDREDEDNGTCSICGCGIRRTGSKFNKLYWATTKCPLKKW